MSTLTTIGVAAWASACFALPVSLWLGSAPLFIAGYAFLVTSFMAAMAHEAGAFVIKARRFNRS